MAGLPGYLTSVKVTGTTTTMTSEAMSTATTAANTYQITDFTKEIWERGIVPTFSGAGSTLSSTRQTDINYLFGRVTFNATQAEPITVSGSYIPTSNVVGAFTYSLEMSNDVLDDTDFQSTGYRTHNIGLHDVTINISRYETADNTFFDAIALRTPMVVEVTPGGSTTKVSC